MNNTIRAAIVCGLAFALSALAAPAHTLPNNSGTTDPPNCLPAAVSQVEWAQLEYGMLMPEVRAIVGSSGVSISDDPWDWRRTWRACQRWGFVEMSFRRVSGRGLVLQHAIAKWQ